jgi:CO/xanthine dehydrogenase FAD-binding subunit
LSRGTWSEELAFAFENMIPKAFDYCRPKTLPEAISLLQQHGDAAKILSGGQSLIPMMKMRLAQPEYLIDINQPPFRSLTPKCATSRR